MLLVDQGNTRLKWRLVDAGGGLAGEGGAGDIGAFAAGLPRWRGVVARVLVSSVAGSAARATLAEAVQAGLGVRAEFLASQPRCAGLANGYTEPARLGVDRWLVMLGARACVRGGLVVVDAGTALTIDAVDAGGHHLGGYILPGLRMQVAALYSGTADVGVPFAAPAAAPGTNTGAAVTNGVALAAVALAERTLVELQERLADTCSLFITGGDAEVLVPLFKVPCTRSAELLFQGMLVQARSVG